MLTPLRSPGWLVQEQLVVALLDTGDALAAETALKPLTGRFPGSQRVGASGARCRRSAALR